MTRAPASARQLPTASAAAAIAGHPAGPRCRPGRDPRPGRAVRRAQPHLRARLTGLPRQSRFVLGCPDELRPVRSHHLHRAVRLLAGPRPGALRLAVQVDRDVCPSTARRICRPTGPSSYSVCMLTWYVLAQPGWAVPNGKSVAVYGLLLKDAFAAAGPTGRSGRSPSKLSFTSCCRCCCSSGG